MFLCGLKSVNHINYLPNKPPKVKINKNKEKVSKNNIDIELNALNLPLIESEDGDNPSEINEKRLVMFVMKIYQQKKKTK